MKTMKLICLLVMLVLIGSAQAALYSEDFTTDPGWTYQGPRTPATIKWEDNIDHGGILNAQLFRDTQGISWCYTNDLASVMGKTINETWDWVLSFDLYQATSYKVYTNYGLVSDTGTTATDGLPDHHIGYRQYPADARISRFYADTPTTEQACSSLSGSGDYAVGQWYTVEISNDSATGIISFRTIVDGVTSYSWTKEIPGSYSFDTFAVWDYHNTSVGSTTQYLDNLRIVPEPATIALLGFGGLAAICKRKRS